MVSGSSSLLWGLWLLEIRLVEWNALSSFRGDRACSFLLRYDLFIYVTLNFNIENDENDTFEKSRQ